MQCRNCGDPVPPERADAGFDYCLRDECVEACQRALNVVAIHVNKSNDQYALREQLDIPEIAGGITVEGGHFGFPRRLGGPEVRARRARTDGQRIDQLRRALEDRLRTCDDEEERGRLIDTYNARVRRMNIRYRRSALYPRAAARTTHEPAHVRRAVTAGDGEPVDCPTNRQ